MSRNADAFLDPAEVDPDHLSVLLERAGWRLLGGRRGQYSRFGLVDEEAAPFRADTSLLVPLNRENRDFVELLEEALAQLRRVAHVRPDVAVPVLDRLTAAPGDELRFRKDTTTVRGAVPWLVGEDLYTSARGLLLAGAKARMSRRAYFGQANGPFAKRFLEAVLMGQTEVGSYVVTAFTPPEREFPDSVKRDGTESLTRYTGREIVESMVSGLAATTEAIDHYRSSNSLSGFEAGVKAGVSRELTDALRKMVINADMAEVAVQWSPSLPAETVPPEPPRFEFSGAVADVLRRASERLATSSAPEYVRVTGWPSVLARPKRGEPGLISLKVRRGSEARTLRVRLTEEQFELAATAMTHERGLEVSGRQERDGNRHWLYDASDLQLVDLEPNAGAEANQAPRSAEKDPSLWDPDDTH